MARAQQGIKFATGTYATVDDITDGARKRFLEVLGRTVPDVLRDLADDEVLEKIFDRVNEDNFNPYGSEAYEKGVKFWRDLQEATGARDELRIYLTDWFNDYGLDETWEWLLDAVISTLWFWREAKGRGRTLSSEERLVWQPYNLPGIVVLNETTRLDISHQFRGTELYSLDKKALLEQFMQTVRPAFDAWYANYVRVTLGGDEECVKTAQQKTLTHFEWLALWQFASFEKPMPELKARTVLSDSTLRDGLDSACKHLKVERRRNPRGRTSI